MVRRIGPQGGANRRALRRAQTRNRVVSVPRDKLGFPQSMSATLRFTEVSDPVLSDNLAHVTTFRANDLFRPHLGVPLHQPRSFDQYMEMYNTFTVTSSKIMVNFCYEGYMGPSTQVENVGPPVSTNLVQEIGTPGAGKVPSLPPVMVGIHKGTEQLQAGEASVQIEKDRTVWKIMTPNSGAVTLGSSLKAGDFFGKDFLVGAAGYTGDDSASPTNPIYWEVWAARATNQHIPADSKCLVRMYVTIEYRATFTDPKTLAAS